MTGFAYSRVAFSSHVARSIYFKSVADASLSGLVMGL